ncbi:MAG: NAD(P)-dependent oxidoreductase [Bacteroidetes bacterium]|nr:NAD(P)-dependent oxidoreductase [Bacteroidota bacterium]
MRILVTGSNGLVGQKLVRLLDPDSGVDLVATAKQPVKGLTKSPFHPMDVTNHGQVMGTIQSIRPEVVIHTAAMTQVDQCETEQEACWLNNVTAVEHLVTACATVGAHLIHISTDFIFDGSYGPLDESAVPHPISYYGESKLAAEKVVTASSIPWTIIRTVLVYGYNPGMSRTNIVLWVKKSLEEGKTIQVVDDQWRTPTLAEDLATGCVLAARKKARGIFHISGDEMMTPYQIALKTADFFGLDKGLIRRADSSTFTQPARRPPKTGFIIDKARIELGYNPHTFVEGLAIIARQLKENIS